MGRYPISAAAICLVLTSSYAYGDASAALSAAKAGQTVTLPEGTIAGPLTVPTGVSVKGAGVNKTIIDAKGVDSGIVVAGGSGTIISDLTIRSAKGAGLSAAGADSLTVARVRATGCSVGIQLKQVPGARIENCVSDSNTFGIVVGSSPSAVVVNCTVSNSSDVGLSLAASPKATVFNNCVSGAGVAINIDEPGDMRVDHNVYFGLYVGRMKQQVGKRMLTGWQYLTGLDAHSVQMPVEFGGGEAGDFTPTSVLPWALDRAASADWGVAELAGAKAPATDMLGQPRSGTFDVGAVESVVKAPRPASGRFTVTEQAGIKSAGVFTKSGMLVTYLFHDLPLPKGDYAFWLPARDHLGQVIPAGDYEVRLAQSDFQWKYLGHVGNNGTDAPGAGVSPQNPRLVTFAPGNLLVMLESASEDGMAVRAYDAATGKVKWHLPGSMIAQGIATGKDGLVYVLRGEDFKTGEGRLTRVDPASGKIIPFNGTNLGHAYPVTNGKAYSMAALGERLYLADAGGNKLFVLTMADGKVEKTLPVASPLFVASDEKAGLLWVISGDSVVAMTPDGKELAKSTPVSEPASLAACEGKLAVASHKSGKVHFFDVSDPKNPKPTREIGKGSMFGEYAADRFFFQPSPGWQNKKDDDGLRVYDLTGAGLAMDAAGQLGVADFHRVSLFDTAGKNLWHTVLVWGGPRPSYSTDNRRVWEGIFSFTLDYQAGTWKTEAIWDEVEVKSLFPKDYDMIGDFAEGGKAFAVYIARDDKGPQLVLARLDGYRMVPVLAVIVGNGQLFSREDTNADGKLTDDDKAVPLTDAAGKGLKPGVMLRFVYLEADGSISTTAGGNPFIWKRTPGLSANGAPIYEGKNYVALPVEDPAKLINPYDFKSPDPSGMQKASLLPVGGYISQITLRGSGGTGLNNAAGTDLAGYAADGRRRWVRLLAQYKGLGFTGTIDGITISSPYYSMETMALDVDGLGLGGFCEPIKAYYSGFWTTTANVSIFKAADGRMHLLAGDHASGRMDWFRLDNQQSLKRTAAPFSLGNEQAAELAAIAWTPAPAFVVQPQPRVKVSRLNSPLKIDGDLEKWRQAGVAPAVIIGPNQADGPEDCSAIVRMAYEGSNLYFQVLKFDNVVTFHQRDNQYLQDSVELAINGTFPRGFQFIVYKTPDGQDLVHRHRFFAEFPARKLRPESAPRIVKVLDDARSVTERTTLEALYGVDLSKSKVIVTEFMLPMDKETWAQAPESEIVQLGPGKTFWIGFFIDDNDVPYTDVQRLSNWPVTFGMFSSTEDGGIAVCE